MSAKSISSFFNKLFSNKYTMLVVWVLLAVLMTYNRIKPNSINNYLIFKYTYFHALENLNLYAEYPESYRDTNHYGPIFSLIIAPFAVLPSILQMYLWQICNALLLFFAIQKLPLDTFKKNMICLVCTQEEYIALGEFQTNGAIAALIILSWVAIQNRKEFWAAFCIILGVYVKLYGIVGLAFFFFADHKLKFIGSLIFWSIVLFILPMAFFSPQYILSSYGDWYHSLVQKNEVNTVSQYQDVSVMGMVRRLVGDRSIPSLPFICCGIILFLLPYLRIDRYRDLSFRLLLLASVLLFTVLFSSGSELVTYIIAFAGVGIWFMSLPRPVSVTNIVIFVFAVYVGSLFMTDLFPRYVKANIMKPYALKALPCLIVWLTILYQMLIPVNKPVQQSDNYSFSN